MQSMQRVLHRWQMTKVGLGLEACGSSVVAALLPPDGSHLALSLRQARQARDVLGRLAPLGMRVLMVGLAASVMMMLTVVDYCSSEIIDEVG